MASQWFKVFVSPVIDCVSQDFYFHQQSAASSAAGAFDLNLIQRLFDFQHIHTIDCTTQLYLSVSLFQPMDIYLGTEEEDFFYGSKTRAESRENQIEIHLMRSAIRFPYIGWIRYRDSLCLRLFVTGGGKQKKNSNILKVRLFLLDKQWNVAELMRSNKVLK